MASGPSRLNFVSVLFFGGLAAAGYGAWKFLPVYYTALQVDQVLGEAVNRCYNANMMREPGRSAALDEIRADAFTKIRALDIHDANLQVQLRIEGATAVAECAYDEVVVHPKIDQTTTVHLRRRASTDIKRIEW